MAKNIRSLKKAIFDKLDGDETLKTLLGGDGRIVHRQPVKSTLYPCVVYAIINDNDYPYNETQDGSSITQTFFRISIFSKNSKSDQSDEIESRVKTLLHGQRSLDTSEIICYSCFRDNLIEPMRDPDIQAWVTPSRYRVTWAIKD
jgi:hypothetical protein